jgi:SOS-response transcriptional repressor LexA
MAAPTADNIVVHAGFPNPATDTSLGSLDLHKLLVRRPVSTFLFRIEGSDWEVSGIFNGDVAVVDRALDPRRSDLVIWHHEGAGEFNISHYAAAPENACVWGVITSTIHQWRRDV